MAARRPRRSRAALADGPLKRKEIDALRRQGGRARRSALWVDMVRVPPSGTWERRRADLYGLAEDWLGAAADSTPTTRSTTSSRRYLTGFGPAAKAEIANWAGLAVKDVEPALERLPLRRFAPRTAPSCSTSPARRSRTPTRPPRCASCRRGTPCCSPTRAVR